MADIVNKDPFTYQKERESFLVHLRQFHSNRRTPFQRNPCIGGKDVDLYLLYLKVTSAGGSDKVNDEQRWDEIQGLFNIPQSCTNSSQALKNVYIRYLELYEKVNFFGEDPDRREYGDEQGARPGRKPARQQQTGGVPLAYNYKQHNVPDYLRQSYGMSSEFVTPSDYAKMEMSLLSGLPNEVDFVFNVCTLLSNRGRHTLRLSDCPRLLDLLLAHVGVFAQGPSSLRTLHEDGWRPNTDRNFLRFWYESVEDKDIRDLILDESYRPGQPSKDSVKRTVDDDIDVGDYLLNINRELGVHDAEGQRVLQLAVIIRNLSFEDENKAFLSSNWLAFRFIMLCIHDKYNCIKQLALDTLSNVASAMVLEAVDYRTTQLMLRTISRCVCSEDKFEVVSGLSIVARLCESDENEEVLSEHIDTQVYERVIQLLTLHDIQLIVFTLETLYQLSELGELTTNAIAGVRFAVETLVSLVTVEAQSYGPSSLIGIKVVEHVPAAVASMQPPAAVPAVASAQAGTHKVCAPATVGRVTAVATPPPPAPPPPAPPQAVQHTQRITHAATPPPSLLPAPPPPTPKIISASQPLSTSSSPSCPPALAHQSSRIDSEAMACNWLQAYYEYGTVKLDKDIPTKIRMYTDYLATCGRHVSRSMVNASSFDSCIRVAFPRVESTKEDKEDGSCEVKYHGIKRRASPMSLPVEEHSGSTGQSHAICPVAMDTGSDNKQKFVLVQPASQTGGGDDDEGKGSESNLIKSLLANKVQRRQQLGDDVKIDEADAKQPARQLANVLHTPDKKLKVHHASSSAPLARIKPRPVPDVKYAVSRARIERLHDVSLEAAEARIEKVQNRYVALLERELERQTPPSTHAVTSGSVQLAVSASAGVTQPHLVQTQQQQPPSGHPQLSLVGLPQIVTSVQPPVQAGLTQPMSNGPALCEPVTTNGSVQLASSVPANSTQLTPTSIDSSLGAVDKMDESKEVAELAETIAENSTDATDVVERSSDMAVDNSTDNDTGDRSSDAWPNAGTKTYMDPLEYCCKLSRISEWSPGPSSCSSENADSRLDADTSEQANNNNNNRTVVAATDSICTNSAVIVPQQLLQQQPQVLQQQPQVLQQQPQVLQQQPQVLQQQSQVLQQQPQVLQQQLLLHQQQQLLQQQLLQQSQPNLLQTQQPQQLLQQQQPLLQQPQQEMSQQQLLQMQPQQLLQQPHKLLQQPQQILQQTQQLTLVNGVLYPQTVYAAPSSDNCLPTADDSSSKDMTNCTVDEQLAPSGDIDTNCVSTEMLAREKAPAAGAGDSVDDIKAMLRKDDELAAKLAGLNGVVKCIGNGSCTPPLCLNGPNDDVTTAGTLQAKLAAIFPAKSLKDTSAILENGFESHEDDSSELTPDVAEFSSNATAVDTSSETAKRSDNNNMDSAMANSIADCKLDKQSMPTPNGLSDECGAFVEQGQGDGNGVTARHYVIADQAESQPSSQFSREPSESNETSAQDSVLAPHAIHAQVAQFMSAGCAFGSASQSETAGDSAAQLMLASQPPPPPPHIQQPAMASQQQQQQPQVILTPQQQQQGLAANQRPTVAIQPALLQQQQQQQQHQQQLQQRQPMLTQQQPTLAQQQQQQPFLAQQQQQQPILAQQQSMLAQQQQQQQPLLAQQQPMLAQQQQHSVLAQQQQILCQPQEQSLASQLQQQQQQQTMTHAQQPILAQASLAPQQMQLGQQLISVQGMVTQPPAHVFQLSSDGRQIGQPRVLLPNLPMSTSGADQLKVQLVGQQQLLQQQQQQQQLVQQQLVGQQLVGQQQLLVTATGQPVQLLPTAGGHTQQVLVSVPPHASSSSAQPTIMAVSLPSGFVEQQLQFVSAGHAVVQPGKQVTVQQQQQPQQQQQQIRLLVSQSQPVLPKPANIAPAQVRLLPAQAPDSRKRPLKPTTDSTAKSAKKKKPVNKSLTLSSSSSSVSSSQSSSTNEGTAPQFMCEWSGCLRCFNCNKSVEQHVMSVHFDRTSPATVCQWHGCDGLCRQKWSFVQHLQERHLTLPALKAAAARRRQQGIVESQPVQPAPTAATSAYPVDAALQAVRRFSIRPPYAEFVEVKEGPVTKHIRLTSALVLRNLARYSALGRSLIKKHEQHLAYVALNSVESSTAIANCLCEMQKH